MESLQVADQHLLGLRVLELGQHAHEVREPLAIHAPVSHLLLAEVEEALGIEGRSIAQLQCGHDPLVRHRTGNPVGGGQHDVLVLLKDAGHLSSREVLAVLADPIIGSPIEEEIAAAIAHQDVAQIARVVDALAVFVGVRPGVVEVALEERRIRRRPTDLPDRVRVVQELSVCIELGRSAFVPPLVHDHDRRIRDLANAAARIRLLTKGADRRFGRAIELEHVVESEPADEALDVRRRRAVADRVAQVVVGMRRDFSEDPVFVACVGLLDRAQDVVNRLPHVIPVGHPVAQHVGKELARAEALTHRETPTRVKGGLEAQEQGIRVE